MRAKEIDQRLGEIGDRVKAARRSFARASNHAKQAADGSQGELIAGPWLDDETTEITIPIHRRVATGAAPEDD